MLFSEPKIPQSFGSRTPSAGASVSVLFSEPKIPQSTSPVSTAFSAAPFQCSSASRKFLNCGSLRASTTRLRSFSALQRAENSSIDPRLTRRVRCVAFQCSSASRKFLNPVPEYCGHPVGEVSVLFSEPKIPQFGRNSHLSVRRNNKFQCSSASRKFLNHTGAHASGRLHNVSVLFSEPKIPQSSTGRVGHLTRFGFSALQRAENSSILNVALDVQSAPYPFQCSSASRKFLNKMTTITIWKGSRRFSALQRAENSSIERYADLARRDARVSVLFSEPKIPQSNFDRVAHSFALSFSALQRAENSSIALGVQRALAPTRGFSALQRAENSSIACVPVSIPSPNTEFQCSSASRKFLN